MRSALLLAALTALACGPEAPPQSTQHWSVARRVPLATGAALEPDDRAKPGEAKPQALATHEGEVLVALTNLHRTSRGSYAAAGPSYLEVLDGESLARRALVRLDEDGARCLNAGAVLVRGGRAFVACAGTFADDGAVAEVELSTRELRRIHVTGGSPGAVAAAGKLLWLGDQAAGRVLALDVETGEVVRDVELCPSRGSTDFPFVPSLASDGARAFAACFSHDEVLAFEPATGVRAGPPFATGDGPHTLELAGDDLFVLDNLGATLTRVRLGGAAPMVDRAILPLGQVPTGLAVRDGLLAVTNSGDGTVTIIDAASLAKRASVDVKLAGGGTDYPWGVAFGRSAGELFVVLNGTGEVARLVRAP